MCARAVSAPRSATGLNRFKIRVKVDVREDPVAALALRGIAAPPPASTGVEVFAVDWHDIPAFDVVGPEAAVAAVSAAVDAPLVDAHAYERARIEAGISRQGVDTDDRTIPQEAGLELVAVSFTKGCFVGQELVCRIDSRGHVNRHLRRLRADAGVMEPGAVVTFGEREIGEVTSTVGGVALAMLRREVEPGARVDVGGTAALVEQL